MIARKPHPDNPDNPERYVFVPLTYDVDRGAWISLLGPEGYYVNHFDAVQECVANFQVLWRNIERVSRRLRAFTEHPSFATFTADGVDALMITETAASAIPKICTNATESGGFVTLSATR